MTEPAGRAPLLALCALLLPGLARADENTQQLLRVVQALHWPYEAPHKLKDWTQVTFVPESTPPGGAPIHLYYPEDPALRGATGMGLFSLGEPAVEGKKASFKSSLTPYRVIELGAADPVTGAKQAVVGRRDKPKLRVRGVTDNFYWFIRFRGVGSEIQEVTVAKPAETDYRPNSPVTAVLDERDPKLKYGESWTFSPLCRDKTMQVDKNGSSSGEREALLSARGTHSLFSRLEHIVMTAVAPDNSPSLLEHVAAQTRTNPDAVAGADRTELAAKARRNLKSLAEKLRDDLKGTPPREDFIPEESRLILCYVRFMGPGVEQAFYESLQSFASAPGDSAQARAGFVAFWRPTAQILLAQTLEESAKVGSNQLTLDSEVHASKDRALREAALELSRQMARVDDWAERAPKPAQEPVPHHETPKDIPLPKNPFGDD